MLSPVVPRLFPPAVPAVSADAPAASAAEPPAASGGSKPLPVILAIVAGLALGAGAGAFGVGPALASGIAPSAPAVAHAKHHAKKGEVDADSADDPDAAPADEEGGDATADEKKGGKEGAASSVYTIDNLVLNPAGSGGTRFLLLSIAFEMKDAAALESIKSRDAELRDAVLVTLGAKSVEQLSDMVARDSLKSELRKATAKALHTRGVKRVYFPQFVIQ